VTWREKEVEWLVRILFGVGGAIATVIGFWVTNKIRVYLDTRNAHLEDIKQRVLIPLRDGLDRHFRPLIFHLSPAVFVQIDAPTQFDEKAKAAEEPTERGEILLGAFPSAAVFVSLDSALLEDAKKAHFREEMAEVDGFIRDWLAYSCQCHSWALKTSREILARSGLPAFPPPRVPGPGFRPYAMNHRLALFVYKRLFRLPTAALRLDQIDDSWTLNGENATLALGSKPQMKGLLSQIDALLTSEAALTSTLRERAAVLQRTFQGLIPKLDYAIASRRLRKRCDLVTLF
jgi:hypothetical protein